MWPSSFDDHQSFMVFHHPQICINLMHSHWNADCKLSRALSIHQVFLIISLENLGSSMKDVFHLLLLLSLLKMHIAYIEEEDK